MALSAFDDKSRKPTDRQLREVLAKSYAVWTGLISAVEKHTRPLDTVWGFTSKKAGWGIRLRHGDRVILYMTPQTGRFLVSFALGEKAVAAARAEKLPKALLDAIDAAPRYVEGRGVRIEVSKRDQIPALAALARIKVEPGVPAGRMARGSKPTLLAGGNPQIAKADGDGPVQAYIRAMPGWKRDVGRRLDALVERTVPGVRKAVKWNSPFYGIEGQGWFLSFHTFTNFVKVTFFQGTSLRPPPSGGKARDARWIDVHEDDLDEAKLAEWIRQAASLPGWGKSG
jgi:hypothetical protein